MGKIEKFDLKGLLSFDGGRLEIAINQEVAKLFSDMKNAPLDKRARKLKIDFALVPIVDPESRDLDGARMGFKCKAELPGPMADGYKLGIREKVGFVFTNEDEDTPLFDGIEQETEKEEDE